MSYKQLILRLPDELKDKMRERLKAETPNLDDIDISPVGEQGIKFRFTIDKKTYPARLVNLPCVLETHKTNDNTTYFKSGDVGQMIIVYKDEEAYLADPAPPPLSTGPNSVKALYPDGLTPPTRNIVERKFVKARPVLGKYSKAKVNAVESQMKALQSASANVPIMEVHEEVVDFEEWMMDAEAAKVNRMEGVSYDIKGPSARDSKNVLFGSELLYHHPEVLLAAHERKDAAIPPSPKPVPKKKPMAPPVQSLSFARVPTPPVLPPPPAGATLEIGGESVMLVDEEELDGLGFDFDFSSGL